MATVQIRDVPDDVHAKLKARAAASGMSLSEYLRDMLERSAARPTADELDARIRARGSVDLRESIVDTIRSIREHGE